MADNLERVVSVHMDKGGVGKTAATVQIGGEAARFGLRVLCVDADPTGALSALYTGQDYPDEPTLTDVVSPAGVDVRSAVRPAAVVWQPDTSMNWANGGALDSTAPGRLDVLPTDAGLAVAAQANGNTAIRRLFQALHRGDRPLVSEYDMVLIDCQPSPDLAAQMAIMASGWLTIVTQPESLSLRGLGLTNAFAHELAQGFDHPIQIGGVIINKFAFRRREHADIAVRVAEWVSENVAADPESSAGTLWDPYIPDSATVSTALMNREPLSAALVRVGAPGTPRLLKLSTTKRLNPIVPKFTRLALHMANLTCPDEVPGVFSLLEAQEMPDEMREALFGAAAADDADESVEAMGGVG